MADNKPKKVSTKLKKTKKLVAKVKSPSNSSVQQNVALVAVITIVVSIISGYMFIRGDFRDGTLFLAIGFALLSSLVDLNHLPKFVRFFVYGLSVIPAVLVLITILRDFA